MATTAAITLKGWGPAKNLQDLYVSQDTNELTVVTVYQGGAVKLYNRPAGATVLVQLQGVVAEAAPASDAGQLLQASERIINAADVGCGPVGPWTFGLACASGTATVELSLTVL